MFFFSLTPLRSCRHVAIVSLCQDVHTVNIHNDTTSFLCRYAYEVVSLCRKWEIGVTQFGFNEFYQT